MFMIKDVIVVGTGTAGWLTSLFIQSCTDFNLTVVKSRKTQAIGFGEGTTPNFVKLLNQIGIDQNDFIKNTNSTIKEGIDFIGWSGDNTSYFHRFARSQTSYHFDAQLIGDYFENIAKERGINIIDGDVTQINKTGEYIDSIEIDHHLTSSDLYIDCTGMKSIFGGERIGVGEYLISNRAVAFSLPMDNYFKYNATDAISDDYGWIWKIPLQDRFGCGYVYNNITPKEKIISNIKSRFPDAIITRDVEFEVGYLKKSWRGNCISIGLSSGFFEPIEATSIMTTCIQLNELYKTKFKDKEKYNSRILDSNQQITSFINYHYQCSRKDTHYWEKVDSLPLYPLLKTILSSLPLGRHAFNKAASIFGVDNIVFDYNSYLLLENNNFKKTPTLL